MRNNRLKRARLDAGYTQREVAERANIDTRMYQRIEYGEREPRASTALKIAQVLDTTADQIFSVQ